MEFGNSAKRIVGALLVILIIGAVLFVLIGEDRREAREREALVLQYESEKRVFDQRINELEREIKAKRTELFEGLPQMVSTLCVGVKASSAEELETAFSVLEPFELPLTVILDAELPSDTITEMLELLRPMENICIIPCGGREAMLRLMEAEGDGIYPLAYLGGSMTTEEAASLWESGFLGLSEDVGATATTVRSAVFSDAMSRVVHIPIGEDNALNAASADAVGRGAGFLLTVETEDLGKTFFWDTVTRVVGRMKESYVDSHQLHPATARDYLEDARLRSAVRKQAEEEFAAFESERKAEIAECEREIERIALKYRWW